jgi:hypothetical protein
MWPAGRAWGGPPFVTDDPEPVEFQHWEVYLFSTYAHSQNFDFATAPGVEVNYGVIPEVQLHLIAPAAYAREGDGGSAKYGYGDTELGAKYRFIKETDTLPMVGVFPLLELPTGDERRGLGNGRAQVFLPVWLQKSWGPWTTYGGGGFWYNHGGDRRNFWRLGWLGQRDFGEHLTLGTEIYHETPADAGAQGHTAFNAGGFWNFDDHRHLLFSAGRDIDGPNRFSCYLGFQLTF